MGLSWDHVTDLKSRTSLTTRVIVRLFGRRLNREVFSPTLCRLHECGKIKSDALHVVAAQFDPTQHGIIGRIVQGR